MASKLLDQLRGAIRARNYSISTERAYVSWAVRYIRFHELKHPATLSSKHLNEFLTHLAVDLNVAANTQNQALSALLFLYKNVLRVDIGLVDAVRAKKPQKLPVVLDRNEVRAVLGELSVIYKLLGAMMYGSGMRLMETLRLRIKDLNFEYQSIHVHESKGAKDRVVTFPKSLHRAVRVQVERSVQMHQEDLARGLGEVFLPYALSRKYPEAAREVGWQYVFPADRLSEDPRSGRRSRHHLPPSTFQKAMKRAVKAGGHLKTRQCTHAAAFVCYACVGKMGWTYARCSSSWVMHRWRRQRCTLMYSSAAAMRCAVRWKIFIQCWITNFSLGRSVGWKSI